jgi:hypothetical protein
MPRDSRERHALDQNGDRCRATLVDGDQLWRDPGIRCEPLKCGRAAPRAAIVALHAQHELPGRGRDGVHVGARQASGDPGDVADLAEVRREYLAWIDRHARDVRTYGSSVSAGSIDVPALAEASHLHRLYASCLAPGAGAR